MSLYDQIISKVELWKKAYDSKYNSFQNYLTISFSDENFIWVNDIEKVEMAKFAIVIIKFMVPYTALDNRTWNNVRLKVFYFVKHEYGDFYEMDYLPIGNGWKIHIHVPLWNHQAVLDSWQVESIDSRNNKIEVDILRDFNKDKTNRSFEVDIDQIKQTLTECLKYIRRIVSEHNNN